MHTLPATGKYIPDSHHKTLLLWMQRGKYAVTAAPELQQKKIDRKTIFFFGVQYSAHENTISMGHDPVFMDGRHLLAFLRGGGGGMLPRGPME